ncbi:glutamine amidotransferase [Nocardia yamanashiensis]|uniref:type 1 glutamine amidotransferase family protein n=1 Tax=Nocardia yamanashiensis TaxID=209247 RepID=UPI001E4DFF71|nr:type 1 glutamine amidotransferase family protein [Nocardia yamanashiensis]UGT40817.1 glutamine amidotransferase [Nocardia yamanashiensis]
MTKTVHLAVYDTFSDWETGHATAHLNRGLWHREPGTWQVKTVGPTTEPVTSMGGLRVVPDLALADLSPADSALLILPGSDTWETGALKDFSDKAAEFLAAGVPVAAICGATFGLAAAGLLDDRKHTSNAAEYLAYSGYSGGANFVHQPAVADGALITGSGVAPVDFAAAIFAKLNIYESQVLEAWIRLYKDNDPAGFFALAEYEESRAAVAG